MSRKWQAYYRGHRLQISNILLHFPYILKVISKNPVSLLEIGCGPADHSMFMKKFMPWLEVSLLDLEPTLLRRNKRIYKRAIRRTFNMDVLNRRQINTLPRYDLVISQGLMEHFTRRELKKIIRNFSSVTSKMVFSVPSDVYKNRDFGNEILRSRLEMERLLLEIKSVNAKVTNYFDIGIRTKIALIRRGQLGFLSAFRLLFFKSCHLLVEIRYVK